MKQLFEEFNKEDIIRLKISTYSEVLFLEFSSIYEILKLEKVIGYNLKIIYLNDTKIYNSSNDNGTIAQNLFEGCYLLFKKENLINIVLAHENSLENQSNS